MKEQDITDDYQHRGRSSNSQMDWPSHPPVPIDSEWVRSPFSAKPSQCSTLPPHQQVSCTHIDTAHKRTISISIIRPIREPSLNIIWNMRIVSSIWTKRELSISIIQIKEKTGTCNSSFIKISLFGK